MGYFRALHGIASVINLEKLSKDLDKECRAALKVKNAYEDFLLNSICHLFSLFLLFFYWFFFISKSHHFFLFFYVSFLCLYQIMFYDLHMYIYINIYVHVLINIFIVFHSDVISSSQVIIKNILSYFLFSCFVIGTWCTPSFRIIWRCICIKTRGES